MIFLCIRIFLALLDLLTSRAFEREARSYERLWESLYLYMLKWNNRPLHSCDQIQLQIHRKLNGIGIIWYPSKQSSPKARLRQHDNRPTNYYLKEHEAWRRFFFIRETSGYGSLYLAKQCNRFILFFVGTGCSLYNPFPTWQRIIEKAVKITYQFNN